MSTATDCEWDLRRTSGGLKPGVPALAACRCGRDRQEEQTDIWPGQEQETVTPSLGLELSCLGISAELQWEVRLARSRPVTPENSVSWLWPDTSNMEKEGCLVRVEEGEGVDRSGEMMELFVIFTAVIGFLI